MVHEELWGQLTKLNGEKTAERAKCQYLTEPNRYIITLLNKEYVVDLADKHIFSGRDHLQQEQAEFLEQLCLLSYLINAQDLPLANKLVRPEALPSGQFFFRGIHSLPTEKLEKVFGDCSERLCQIAEKLSAEQCEFGDASIKLHVLPRVPLTIVIWSGDDEFVARASILFDQTAATHLPLDALLASVNLAVDAVIKASE